MEKTTISGLLSADQVFIKNSLLADKNLDHDLNRSVHLLEEELGKVFLKYNASHSDDLLNQTASECMMATAREQLRLLHCIETKQEQKKKEKPEQKGLTALLLGIIFLLTGVLFADKLPIAGYLCIAFGFCFAFLSGRTWHSRKTISASLCINPDLLLRTLNRTAETMDRKMEEFQTKSQEHEKQITTKEMPAIETASLNKEELALYGDLLEALCSNNGDFALKQLQKILPYLKRHGITPKDYDGENKEDFELLPSKRGRRTLRPALFSNGQLVAAGRASDQIDHHE